jgi:outer membrane protein
MDALFFLSLPNTGKRFILYAICTITRAERVTPTHSRKEGTPMKKCIPTLMIAALATLLAASAWAEEPAAAAASKVAAPAPVAATETKPPLPAPTVPLSAPPRKVEQPVKIGYLEMAKIASDSVPGKAVQSEIKTRTDKYRSQIKAKEKQLEKLKKSIEAQVATLSPQQREAKAKDFQKKVEEYRNLVIKADKDVNARQEKLLGDLYKSVEKASSDYGKANGFAAVVMKKELLYSAENVEVKDLTAEIIKLIESQQVKK